jgi:hypothetical protein
VAGSCEFGNELSGSIKCGEFLYWLQTGQLLKKDSAPWTKQVNTVRPCKDICPVLSKHNIPIYPKALVQEELVAHGIQVV